MKTIVLFRADRRGKITAVFPYDPATLDPHTICCYSHVGQHSACTMGWFRGTRPAEPEEYAELKRELENYGPPGGHYDLDVRRRMPSDAMERRCAALIHGTGFAGANHGD